MSQEKFARATSVNDGSSSAIVKLLQMVNNALMSAKKVMKLSTGRKDGLVNGLGGIRRSLDISDHTKGPSPVPNRLFFLTLFKRPLTPPPSFLNIYVADFSKGFLKKCVNACRDKCVKIVRKSLGKSVQYIKKL